mmetsp:Transcript_70152/g.139115  ORF Transcript_70152/g.139115 Transcript_70152/m.139115 type:complete len:212 (-) Transcript_70152:85-720(-)
MITGKRGASCVTPANVAARCGGCCCCCLLTLAHARSALKKPAFQSSMMGLGLLLLHFRRCCLLCCFLRFRHRSCDKSDLSSRHRSSHHCRHRSRLPSRMRRHHRLLCCSRRLICHSHRHLRRRPCLLCLLRHSYHHLRQRPCPLCLLRRSHHLLGRYYHHRHHLCRLCCNHHLRRCPCPQSRRPRLLRHHSRQPPSTRRAIWRARHHAATD